MSDTLSVELHASLTWLFSEGLALSTIHDQAALEFAATLDDGTGDSQADKLWHAERTVAAGANDDLDLTALAATVFGGSLSISLARVKAILLLNISTTAGHELRVGGAGPGTAFASPFNDNPAAVVEVGASSCLFLCNQMNGWIVTPGAGNILRIHNPNAAPVTYRIAVAGTSA